MTTTLQTPASTSPSWLKRNGKALFYGSWDFRAAVTALVAAGVLMSLSETARAQSGPLSAATLGICGGLLGVVLGAMAITTAFVTRSFVAIIGDIRHALLGFTTVAVVAATGLLFSLTALALAGAAWWWITAALLALCLALTTWTAVGTVQLVMLVVYFATVRAREMTTLLEAEGLRTERLRAAGR